MECVFCAIINGNLPGHKVWEDEKHLAILSIFPNTKGMTVVFPKKHFSSYAFDLEDEVLKDLVIAAKRVGKRLDAVLPTCMRTGLVLEGFGVDHVHAKLYPLHNKAGKKAVPKETAKDDYYEEYPGFIASHDSRRAEDKELAALAKLIREA